MDSIDVSSVQAHSFFQLLRAKMPDTRDVRGLRHSLEFPLVAIVIAVLSQCKTLSSIQRFMVERLAWLQEATGMATAMVLSRSYMDVFLAHVDWSALSVLTRQFFGVGLSLEGWIAIDGKVLCGSSRDGRREATVLAVAHGSALEVASAPQSGLKSSEVPVVRELLVAAGLANGRITLDALHCNPATLGLIAQATGLYITQVKGNQPELLVQCCALGIQEPPLARVAYVSKGHGRVVTRTYQLFALRPGALHQRWHECRARYLITVVREVYTAKTQSTTVETSYYITNMAPTTKRAEQLGELAKAIQGHWAVESNNWVRDVTLGEDGLRMKEPKQAQVMALLRGIALTLLRKVGSNNLQALIEKFCYTPASLLAWLTNVKFL